MVPFVVLQDQGVLLLRYADTSDKQNMAKAFCPQRLPELQRGIHKRNKYKHSENLHHALEHSEHSVFPRPPFIQWVMPVFMSEQYRPSPRLTISVTSPETPRTHTHTAEGKMGIDVSVSTRHADPNPTVIETATVSVPPKAAAEIMSASTSALNTSALTTTTTRGTTTQHKATTSKLSGVLWGLLVNAKPLTTKTNKQPVAEQTSAENSSNFNNEAKHQSGPNLARSENIPQITTASTQTSSAKSLTSATIKTSTKPRTFCSTNNERYTSKVEIKTPAATAEVFGSTAATTTSTKPCNAETPAQTRRNEEGFTLDFYDIFWGFPDPTKTTGRTAEQTSAANPSNYNNETTCESGSILVSDTTTTQPSMISDTTSTTNTTTKTTKTSTEPRTASSTNTELYTTDVGMKTSPAATQANANPVPVNCAGSTMSSTENVATAHEAETAASIDSKTEAKTNSTTPTNITNTETNTIAWTLATATPRAPSNPTVPRPVATTSMAVSPTAPTAPVMDGEATATTAPKTSTAERATPGTGTAADSSGKTTTEFKRFGTKLLTTASTLGSTECTSTEVPGSPGPVIPLTTSAVNVLAKATQTMLTATRFTFTCPISATVPETTTSVDSASTAYTADVHLSTLLAASSAKITTRTSRVISVSSTSGGDVAETTISTTVIKSTVVAAQTPGDLTHTPLFGYLLTTEAEANATRRTTSSSAATQAANSTTALNTTRIHSGVSTLLLTNTTSVETSAEVTAMDENITSISANSAKTTIASNFESVSTMTPEKPTDSEDASVLFTNTRTATAAGPSIPANIAAADTQTVDHPVTPGATEVFGSTAMTITPPTKPSNDEKAMVQTSRNEEQGFTLDFYDVYWGFPDPSDP